MRGNQKGYWLFTKKRELILHIGAPKAGSTAIQRFIIENSCWLEKSGIFLLSGFGEENHFDFVAYFTKNLDSWSKSRGIKSMQEKEDFFQDFTPKFESNLDTGDIRSRNLTTLITSEHFFSRLQSEQELISLKKFLQGYFSKITIILFLRPQEEMAISQWSTKLKHGYFGSMESHMSQVNPENHYFDFYGKVKMWSAVFGRKNLRIESFNGPDGRARDVRLVFLKTIQTTGLKLEIDRFTYSHKRENTSLPLLRAHAYRAVNEAINYWDNNPENIRAKNILDSIPALDVGNCSIVNPGQIQDLFTVDNQRLEKEFGVKLYLSDHKKPSSSEEEAQKTALAELANELTKALLTAQYAK